MFNFYLLVICISLIILLYNLIPEKSKELLIKKRLKSESFKNIYKNRNKTFVGKFLKSFLYFLEKKVKRMNSGFILNYKDSIENFLIKAGELNNLSVDKFIAIQIASSIGMLCFYIVFLVFLLEIVEVNLIFIFLSLLIGFYYPLIFWLKSKIKTRNFLILRDLPDMIDLLTLCIEAGLDFNAGLRKIVEKGKHGPLKEEFKKLEKDIHLGLSRIHALRNMANRVEVEELNSLVIVIVQAIKMGSSIGPILREQSRQLRIRRSQLAEKLASEAPIKMLAPLIICIFPTVFIILFVPIVLQMLGFR